MDGVPLPGAGRGASGHRARIRQGCSNMLHLKIESPIGGSQCASGGAFATGSDGALALDLDAGVLAGVRIAVCS